MAQLEGKEEVRRSGLSGLIRLDLELDWRTVVITVVSTLLMIVNSYHLFTPYIVVDKFILYLLIPLGIIIFVFRDAPSDYGFCLGDWRAGLLITGLGVILLTPLIWLVASGDAGMRQYYQGQNHQYVGLVTFLDLVGWEFLFRGFILFRYAKVMGDHALWLQAVPFALGHLRKPELETISTIFGGFLFGLVAWRTKSFLYGFLIHWYIATLTILVAAGAL